MHPYFLVLNRRMLHSDISIYTINLRTLSVQMFYFCFLFWFGCCRCKFCNVLVDGELFECFYFLFCFFEYREYMDDVKWKIIYSPEWCWVGAVGAWHEGIVRMAYIFMVIWTILTEITQCIEGMTAYSRTLYDIRWVQSINLNEDSMSSVPYL